MTFGPRIVGDKPVSEMFAPGRCLWCGAIYDAGPVKVIARYSDCSVWIAPCCEAQVDDRPRSWGGRWEPIKANEADELWKRGVQ